MPQRSGSVSRGAVSISSRYMPNTSSACSAGHAIAPAPMMAPVVLEGWLWFFYVQCAYNHMREPERSPEGDRSYGIAQSWPDAHDEDGDVVLPAVIVGRSHQAATRQIRLG